jgi:DNA polymerase III beta subunit
VIQAGRSRFNLPVLPAGDFPVMSSDGLSGRISVDTNELIRLIDKTRFAISTEETRYYLNGLYLHTVNDGGVTKLRAVATDGHRLALAEMDAPEGAAGLPGIIVPRKTIQEARRLMESAGEQVDLQISAQKVRFEFGRAALTSKVIDGAFPDYLRVIPRDNAKILTLDNDLFAKAVDRVATISAEKSRSVKLAVEPGRITLTVRNMEAGQAVEEVEVDYDGEAFEIGFNARYLLDVCGQIGGPIAEFRFADPASPTLVVDPTDPGVKYVLMPLRVVNEDGFSKLVVQDFRTKRALPQPELPAGVVGGLGFSADGEKLGFSLSTPTASSDAWSWGVTDGKLQRWTASELGGLDAKALATPQLVRFPSFDKRSIPAFVYKPKLAAGAKAPVIIDIHGGPEAQSRPIFSPIHQHFVGELGAAVIVTNVRGSSGYGKTYLNLDNAEKREDSVKDIGALLDWIKTQPDLDPSRVVVYGQSYGGYMSLAVMTHYSDRLAGGVERYGISNFVSFLTNTEAYRRDLRRAEYGDERDPKMLKAFETISPMNSVGKISKPMLVMQGWNDPRVPKSESDQVVAKLREQGVETWYVQFKDEGHGFLKKSNNDRRREVETQFLQKVLAIRAGSRGQARPCRPWSPGTGCAIATGLRRAARCIMRGAVGGSGIAPRTRRLTSLLLRDGLTTGRGDPFSCLTVELGRRERSWCPGRSLSLSATRC